LYAHPHTRRDVLEIIASPLGAREAITNAYNNIIMYLPIHYGKWPMTPLCIIIRLGVLHLGPMFRGSRSYNRRRHARGVYGPYNTWYCLRRPRARYTSQILFIVFRHTYTGRPPGLSSSVYLYIHIGTALLPCTPPVVSRELS